MNALILIVSSLLGLSIHCGDALPQYTNYHHKQPVKGAQKLHHHYHHEHHHDVGGVHIDDKVELQSAEEEDPEALRQPNVGLLLITQNPNGLCREDKSSCDCYKQLREQRFTECHSTIPLWTVETLWQGTVPRSKRQPQVLSACSEDHIPAPTVITALNELTPEEHDCLMSVWPPLVEAEPDCTEDSAIIRESIIQGNCAKDFENFNSLDEYYTQVTGLYKIVNGLTDFCQEPVKDCRNHTATSDSEDISIPQQADGTVPMTEKIDNNLRAMGLSSIPTLINLRDIKTYFHFNVYMGCMQSTKGQNLWIITRIGFCFRCPRGNQPCDDPEPVDCWTGTSNPPATVPWGGANNDKPCYTNNHRVCYCGFDSTTECTC